VLSELAAAEARAETAEWERDDLQAKLTEAFDSEVHTQGLLNRAGREQFDRAEALQAQLTEAERELAIMKLSIPIEDELSERVSDVLKYLAMQQGFTLNGLARLFVDCQHRMAADWSEIGQLRREGKQLVEAERVQQALRERLKALARDIGNVGAVAERRQIFDSDHERKDHQQMLTRLRAWQTEVYAAIDAALTGAPSEKEHPQDVSAVSATFEDTCPRCGTTLEYHEGLERDYPSCPRCR